MNDVLTSQSADLTDRIARRLRELRGQRDWSLDQLAARSGVSRATLSRLEKARVSPTTEVLGRLCTAYGLTLSRLLAMVEEDYPARVTRGEQPEWRDDEGGFTRRQVSPPSRALRAEVIECSLDAGARIHYAAPSVPGLEHHLVLLQGGLEVTVAGQTHGLEAGDCLRYQLFGATSFLAHARHGARYLLTLVNP